jgi:hypothetical protein
MKIGFHAGTMNYRGVHVAIYDYALHNQLLLGNESVIYYDGRNPGPQFIVDKFKRHFELVSYDRFENLNRLAEESRIDALYFQKAGLRDAEHVTSVPNLIHAVFPQKVSEQHGDVYAFVSRWLSKECSNSKIPFVELMVQLPAIEGNLRKQFDIPSNAMVIGCYGGEDSFNIDFVKQAVCELAQANLNLYFLFMNIDVFTKQERVLFLPGTPDMNYKRLFIQTCDVMLHAREMGESCGVACAEFSICNKPIITYGLSRQRCHIEILRDRGLLYNNKRQLKEIINNLDRTWIANRDWDCYSDLFSPHKIMQQFKNVFLDSSSGNRGVVPISLIDRCYIFSAKLKKKVRGLQAKYERRFDIE